MNPSMDPVYLFLAADVALGVGSVWMMWRTKGPGAIALSLVPLLMLAVVGLNESIEREVSALAPWRPRFGVAWASETISEIGVLTTFALFFVALLKRRRGRVFIVAATITAGSFFIWAVLTLLGAASPGIGG